MDRMFYPTLNMIRDLRDQHLFDMMSIIRSSLYFIQLFKFILSINTEENISYKYFQNMKIIYIILLILVSSVNSQVPGTYQMTGSSNWYGVTCCIPASNTYLLVENLVTTTGTSINMKFTLASSECDPVNGVYAWYSTISKSSYTYNLASSSGTITYTSTGISFYSSSYCSATYTLINPSITGYNLKGNYNFSSATSTAICNPMMIKIALLTSNTILQANLSFPSTTVCQSSSNLTLNLPVNSSNIYTWMTDYGTIVTIDGSSLKSSNIINYVLSLPNGSQYTTTLKPTTGCFSNSDCSYPSLCSSGSCTNCPYMSCSTDADCSPQPICSGGSCIYQCSLSSSCGSYIGQRYCPNNLICASSGNCVQCTTNSNCPSSSPYCLSTGLCSATCVSNSNCPSNTPICNSGTCVQCTQGSNCPSGSPFCNNNLCSSSCLSSSQCPTSKPICSSGTCLECLTNSNCPTQTPICGSRGSCVQCTSNSNCPSSLPYCDLTSATCTMSCTSNSQCSALSNAPYCVSGTCVQCTSNSNCPTNTPYCNMLTNQCSSLCVTDSQCPGSTYCNSAGACVECYDNSQCDNLYVEGGVCKSNKCYQCAVNTDCYSGRFCVDKTCMSTCTANSQCSNGQVCYQGSCVDCGQNSDCSYFVPICLKNNCVECLSSSDCNTFGPYCTSQNFCSNDCTQAIDEMCPTVKYGIIGGGVVGMGVIIFIIWKVCIGKKAASTALTANLNSQVEMAVK